MVEENEPKTGITAYKREVLHMKNDTTVYIGMDVHEGSFQFAVWQRANSLPQRPKGAVQGHRAPGKQSGGLFLVVRAPGKMSSGHFLARTGRQTPVDGGR